MFICKISRQKLSPIKELRIDLEKDLQSLTENNLEEIFGLKFIRSEFQLHNLRIDTLAFDEERKAFVIIEYKRDKSSSIIDQGYAYLSLLLNQKAEFILEYNERNGRSLKKDDVDWSQTCVYFLANNFTPHQRSAINFKDLPIKLWEVKRFDGDLIMFNQLKSSETSESIKTISNDGVIESVSREVMQYTAEDLFGNDWDHSWEIFEMLSERVFAMDPRIELNPTKQYIGYKIGSRNVVNLSIQKTKIILELLRTKPEDLKDPEDKVRYRDRSLEYFNQHISQFDVKSIEDIDYAIFLTKQVYEKHFKK